MRVPFTQAFLLFLSIVVGAELVGRVFFTRTLSGRFDYGYHPTAGFVENANGTVRLERAGGRRFFPQEFTLEKPKGIYRAMVVGDSVARGKNVVSSYAGQLGEVLRGQGIPAEAFNLAVPGYGARRKELTAAQALTYDLDLLVLHVNGSNEYEDEREWMRFQEFASWHPKNWLMKSVIVRRLYEVKTEKIFWAWLPAKIRALSAVSDADAEVSASRDDGKLAAWKEVVREHTHSTIEKALAADVKVLLVTQVIRELDSDGRPRLIDTGLDTMTEPMLGEKVARVSMKEVAESQTNLAELFADGTHLRQSGHVILAEAIATKLDELHWLPEAGKSER